MPRRKLDEDFNVQVHNIYERIASGESAHNEPTPEAETFAPEKPKKAEKPEKVFDPQTEPAKWHGQLGGKKGGKTHTESMSPEERKKLAERAAAARWGKK